MRKHSIMRILIAILVLFCANSLSARGSFWQKNETESLQDGIPPQRGLAGNSNKYLIHFSRVLKNSQGLLSTHVISTPYLSDFAFRMDTTLKAKENYISTTNIQLGVGYIEKKTVYPQGTINSLTKEYPVYRVEDNTNIDVISYGITPENKDFFRFHVLLADSTELVPWSIPSKFEKKNKAEHSYAVLWSGYYAESKILIEVYDIRNYSNREGVMLNWNSKPMPLPRIVAFQATKEWHIDGFDYNSSYQFSKDSLPTPYYTGLNTQHHYPENLNFPLGTFSSFTILLDVLPGNAYILELKKHLTDTTSTIKYQYVGNANAVVINQWVMDSPGKYEIEISSKAPRWDNDIQKIELPFEVRQPLKVRTFSLKQIIPYALLIILCALILFYLYYRYNSHKLRKWARDMQTKKIQLRVLLNQLNPHFIFNSLSSIQNLLNKNENEKANAYLTRFSRLTRSILDDSSKDLITIEEEYKLVEDYLQMEQMRFGFQYNILLDEKIDTHNGQVPPMLLQPLVENAVKHGIVDKRKSGFIEVSFLKKGTDMILKVKDNGNGFDPENISTGKGLELTQNRISLLNTIYKNTPLSFTIEPANTGTTATIHLKNWLS